MLQSVVLLLLLGASWWACQVDGAGLTSAGACWALKMHVGRLQVGAGGGGGKNSLNPSNIVTEDCTK